MSELVDKQVNEQHAKLPQAHEKVCNENERKKQRKKRRAPKIFFDGRQESVYKVRAENSCHGYQMTSGQRFFIH